MLTDWHLGGRKRGAWVCSRMGRGVNISQHSVIWLGVPITWNGWGNRPKNGGCPNPTPYPHPHTLVTIINYLRQSSAFKEKHPTHTEALVYFNAGHHWIIETYEESLPAKKWLYAQQIATKSHLENMFRNCKFWFRAIIRNLQLKWRNWRNFEITNWMFHFISIFTLKLQWIIVRSWLKIFLVKTVNQISLKILVILSLLFFNRIAFYQTAFHYSIKLLLRFRISKDEVRSFKFHLTTPNEPSYFLRSQLEIKGRTEE